MLNNQFFFSHISNIDFLFSFFFINFSPFFFSLLFIKNTFESIYDTIVIVASATTEEDYEWKGNKFQF